MSNFLEFWNSLGFEKYILIVGVFLGISHWVLLIYRAVLLVKKQRGEGGEEPVSVIFTCMNKAQEIKENLGAFLEQDYPHYEVIVVDECSEDETQEVLADLQKRYPHLKTTRIFPGTKFRRTKKIAINIGVLAASHDILLFSEIDARPATKNWVRTMQSYFTPSTAVVVGYANYEKKGIFAVRCYFRFLRFWMSLMLTKVGMPVIANAYNMGYRKKYYLEKRGFSKNSQEYIGFDTEMVEELAEKGDVKIVKEENARMVILSDTNKTWKDDFSYYYATKKRWPMQALFWSHLSFILEMFWYGVLFYFLVSHANYLYFCLLICLTFLMDVLIVQISLKQFGLKKLFVTSLLVNGTGVIYKGFYSIYSIFTRKKWR